MRRVLLVAALGGLLAGPASAKIIDRVVALVNDEVVTQSELEEMSARQLVSLDGIPDPVLRERQRDKIYRKALDELVGNRLVMQEAARLQLNVTGADVDAHLLRVRTEQKWSDEQLRGYLRAQGLSLAEFRKQVREQLLRQKVVRTVVGRRVRISDGDLVEYYKDQMAKMKGDVAVEAAHIVLLVPPNATPVDEAATRQQANELLARTKTEDFSALATKYSQGPGATNGGSLGTVSRGSGMPEPLVEALLALKEGEVAGPIRTQFGFHIVKSLKRSQAEAPSFEASKQRLRRELTDRRLNGELIKWVDELKKKAFVELRL